MIDSSDILEEIRRNNIREHEVDQTLKKENGLAWKQDGIIYIEEQIYIPNNRKIKEQILQENYNSVDVGHLGQSRMLELIKQNYWWLGIKEDVKKYVQECFKYQQNKVQHQKKSGELHPLNTSQGPWQEISINIIGPLPKSNGMDAIVVIMDIFTKIIRLKATTTNISSKDIAKIYSDEIWKLYGIPRKIHNNKELQFVLKFMEEFTKALGTTSQLSTAYYPQTDRQTERINQEIGTFLQHYVNY